MTAKTEPTMPLQRVIPEHDEIKNGIALARQKGIALVDHLLQQAGFSEDGLADGFVDWLKIPRVKIASLIIDPESAKAITEKIALKHQCLPLKVDGKRLVMAMADPADYEAIQEVQFVSGLTVQPVVATRSEILDGISELYHTDERMQEFVSQVSGSEDTFPCPKCRSTVNREFKSCPFCGYHLRNVCQACGQDLNPEWNLCPYCSSPANDSVKQVAAGIVNMWRSKRTSSALSSTSRTRSAFPFMRLLHEAA
jgi:hypothetical protein